MFSISLLLIPDRSFGGNQPRDANFCDVSQLFTNIAKMIRKIEMLGIHLEVPNDEAHIDHY
jgi:hypothetical protein